jgi:uncharacterized membrane protein YgcG
MMNDNDTTKVDDKLEDALALLAAGIPVDDILAEAGVDAEWLRPLLALAGEVGELQAAVPVPSPEASLERMLAYGRELAATTPPAAPVQPNWVATLVAFLSNGWLPRLAAGLASAFLLVFLLGGMVTVLAQRSLPGQPLYGLKRAVENARLNLTFNPETRAQLLETYNQQRQAEAKLLLQQNEVAKVGFWGVVQAINETSLTLADFTVQLTPQTQVNGTLAAGARVEIEALTQPPDHLTALTITVIEPAPPTPTPLPSPTATPSPTPTPSLTATATSTRSLSSDTDILILPTLTPTATSTPAPTDTPTLPPPTVTPIPPTATLPPLPTTPVDNNTNGGGSEGSDNNSNGDNSSPEDNNNGDDNSNDNSGGDDNSNGDDSGGNDNSGGGDDNSSSGSDDSGGGGDDSGGGNDNSGGGDDNSGHGSSNSGSGGDDNDNRSKD